MPWKTRTYWETAAYYPHEGYGGSILFDTEKQAIEYQRYMLDPKRGYKSVHVRKVEITLISTGDET